MRFDIVDDYCIVTEDDGTTFLIDREDISKVDWTRWFDYKRHLYGLVDGKQISLAKQILGISDDRRVMRKVKGNDYRKSNLYCGNKFTPIENCDWFEVETYCGDVFYISECDYDDVRQYSWVIGPQGYVTTKLRGTGRTIKLHRMLMGVVDNKSIEVDHINRDPRDNRRENLRLVTRSENMCNTDISSSNKSGVKGVYWHSAGNAWAAQIRKNKHTYYLGLFNTIEEAKAAREAKEKELW